MFFYCVFLAIAFFIVGLLFWSGKGFELIKAWRTSPQAERDKVNLKRLGPCVALEFISVALIVLLAGLMEGFRQSLFIWCMIGWFLLTGLNIYLMQKRKWYLKK